MDITNNPVETRSVGGEGEEEDKKKSQSSVGGACAEDKQGLSSTDVGGDVVVAPIAPNPEKTKKPSRVKKVVMERAVATPAQTIDIDADPLFFAKLNLVSKRIEQDARRHRISALSIV